MGEFSLFLTAFLAATILPFSSEVAFLTAISSGMNPSTALLFASLGNVTAIAINYLLGYYFYKKTKKRVLKNRLGKKSFIFAHKYGYYALLFSWLPVVGDPITLIAGLIRLRFIYFIFIAGFLRIVRYYMLTLVV